MKVYLPNDADGNVIPSNVKVMYEKDGTVRRVDDMIYFIGSNKWRVLSGPLAFEPDELYLIKSDNLKRLAADLDRMLDDPLKCTCAYAGREIYECSICKLKENKYGCVRALLSDVATRVHRFAGDSE